MHIAANGYFWNKPNSGSGQYTRNLLLTLDKLVSDLKITLVYPQLPGESLPDDVPLDVGLTAVPIRPGNLGKVQFEQQRFPQVCREIGADLAHVPYWGGPLRSPVPLVVTVHDLTTMLVPEYRRGFNARLYNALVSASARGANHIITDSQASKAEIRQHLHISDGKITPIHLAVTADYQPEANSLLDMAVLRKYDLPDFYILYLGGYEIHKNVATLLLAWTYVGQALGEDYPLVLAGKKPDVISHTYPDYADYIKRLDIEEYVRWIGYVDEADKPILYRYAETFVFPSGREGFGLPVLEALSCGVPVVTTNATSLPEVVGEAGFTVDPNDARGMAGAIISTVVQDNLAAELRKTAVQQAAKFSWKKTATETLLVYDKVVRG
ncbi:MAG: glycosyltransferase family 4 protein [Chloroflexi bacterium]|nr:glycosyltransferase family 4 protein [Chloroflexota bacterium]